MSAFAARGGLAGLAAGFAEGACIGAAGEDSIAGTAGSVGTVIWSVCSSVLMGSWDL
ncbi:MAG TPA: hypothetical protein VIL79_07180 [Thermoleophilia bacterium]